MNVNLSVRVIKSSNTYWYQEKIGEIIKVDFKEILSSGKIIYRIGGRGGRGIYASDCVIISLLDEYPTLSKEYNEKI